MRTDHVNVIPRRRFVVRLVVSIVVCVGAFALGAVRADAQSGDELIPRNLVFDAIVPEVLTSGTGYALIVAANGPDRRFAERDAEAVYASLISPEGGNFSPAQVRKLTGPEATADNLRLEFADWLEPRAGEGDRVLVYYAGSGVRDTDAGPVVALSEAGPTSEFFPVSDLVDAVGRVRARDKAILFDATRPGDLPRAFRSTSTVDESLLVFAGARDREAGRESEQWGGGNGAFTHFLVRALAGAADQFRDGAVSAGEVVDYVRRSVREATGNAQTPSADGPDFDPEMLLAYVPSNVEPAPRAEPGFATLVIESLDPEATIVVDGNVETPADPTVPLQLGGLRPGVHTVRAVRTGHEAFGPIERMLYPGQVVVIQIPQLPESNRPEEAVREFERGFDDYGDAQYDDAIGHFEAALERDPEYAVAADFLARSEHQLFRLESSRAHFERAIALNPGDVDTRTNYGSLLLSMAEGDEAIRQLNLALEYDPDDAVARYLLAEAFRRNGQFEQAIVHARRATQIEPTLAEAHFWLADSLRLTGDYEGAKLAYAEYIKLSDFDSGLAGNLNYWVLGFLIGGGERTRNSREDVWKELQRDAWFGLCDSEFLLGNYESAVDYCRRSLNYDSENAYGHYLLGMIYAEQANQKLDDGDDDEASGLVAAALQRFETMLEINPYLEESEYARRTVENIAAFLASR